VRAEDQMRRQNGVITRQQALTSGLTRTQIDYRLAAGVWLRVYRGVYRHRAVPVSWRQNLLACTLAADGVASHRCAAALHGIGGFKEPRLEVTRDHALPIRRLAGVTIHRSTQWAGRQPLRLFGIACTGIERTIMDTAGTTSVDHTERLAEDAVRHGQTSFRSLARYLVLYGCKGRTGSANLRTMLMRREPTARLPLSDFSRVVTNLLTNSGLAEPVLEFDVVDRDGRFIMRADLAWPARKRIVELDGLAWHFGRSDVERDRRKRARARADGWRIMEVLWTMYANEPDDLVRLVRRFLHD